MQFDFDETFGYFNDVPYFTPVETTVFYETVQSCRLHKLPGHLMVGPRSIPFFVKPETELAKKLGDSFKTATGTHTKSASAVLPEFKVDFSSSQPLFKKSGADYITVREACPRGSSSDSEDDIEVVKFTRLDVATIDQIWTNLLLFLNGVSGATSKFCIRYSDVSLTQSDGYGECLLSLLLAGVASLLHFYSQKESCRDALEAISVEFVVLDTSDGANAADKLQFYLENKLKLSATRLRDENFVAAYDEIMSNAQCFDCSEDEFVENVCSEAVDAHEMLVDAEVEHDDAKLDSPVILLIVPHIAAVRSALTTQVLDSYSSEPLRVQSDSSWSLDELNKPSPVVFLCSSAWLVSQMGVAREESLLSKLNVKAVIHGGFCEIASAPDEETVRCVVALQSCGARDYELRVAQLQTPTFVNINAHRTSSESEVAAQSCGATLLLLFRRFVMRYSPESRQPFVSIGRELFCTQRAYQFFSNTVRALQAAGIIGTGSEASSEIVELAVLGRFLSFQFRVGNSSADRHLLNLTDGKAILWAFLLRQPLSVPKEIAKKHHIFNSWVDSAVAQFCSEYQLSFDFQDSVQRRDLVEQLAQFGFHAGDIRNRVHYLLSSPTGTRFSLRPHLTGAVPTVCRGWYEQAPLDAGLALEKKEVHVVCLPPKASYCEMEVVENNHRLCLQCPLELSYPILVAHSVLHISLHNICVFSETTEPNVVMPLPANLLESGVMRFLMSGFIKTNAGLWLDGIMNEITPAASDASVLAPLSLRGKRHIQHCEREVFVRKKRRVTAAAESAADSDLFRGVLPRTAAERSAIEELVDLIKSIGREKAEKAFRGKKGFNFLETSHELHPFYLHSLKKG